MPKDFSMQLLSCNASKISKKKIKNVKYDINKHAQEIMTTNLIVEFSGTLGEWKKLMNNDFFLNRKSKMKKEVEN